MSTKGEVTVLGQVELNSTSPGDVNEADKSAELPASLYRQCLTVLRDACLRARDMVTLGSTVSQLENELTRLYLWGEYFENGKLEIALKPSKEVELEIIGLLRSIGSAVSGLSSMLLQKHENIKGEKFEESIRIKESLLELLLQANVIIADNDPEELFSEDVDIDVSLDATTDLCNEIRFNTGCLMQYAPLLRDNLSRAERGSDQTRQLANKESSEFKESLVPTPAQAPKKPPENDSISTTSEPDLKVELGPPPPGMALVQTSEKTGIVKKGTEQDEAKTMIQSLVGISDILLSNSGKPSLKYPSKPRRKYVDVSKKDTPEHKQLEKEEDEALHNFKVGQWFPARKQDLQTAHVLLDGKSPAALTGEDLSTTKESNEVTSGGLSDHDVVDVAAARRPIIKELLQRLKTRGSDVKQPKKEKQGNPPPTLGNLFEKADHVSRVVHGDSKTASKLNFSTTETPERTYTNLLRSELFGDPISPPPRTQAPVSRPRRPRKRNPRDLMSPSSLLMPWETEESRRSVEADEETSHVERAGDVKTGFHDILSGPENRS